MLCEPGRSLVANAGVTLYTVGTVKEIPGVRTYVAVDGGMSDNLRPMLYDARLRGRDRRPLRRLDALPDRRACTASPATCWSATRRLRTRVPGDVLVMPATGAYGHAMANNYNAVPRPPVIFCRDGDARVVVRRETYDDLSLRELE